VKLFLASSNPGKLREYRELAADAALEASKILEDEGFLAVAIRPPTVRVGTARLRFVFCADHADEDVARLATIVGNRLNIHATL